jgi:hypothetical protein
MQLRQALREMTQLLLQVMCWALCTRPCQRVASCQNQQDGPAQLAREAEAAHENAQRHDNFLVTV